MPPRPEPAHNARPGLGLLHAAALALAVAIGNGFARFAYALILPAMRSDLHWSYTDAGLMNTANAIGYLIGAALALQAVRWLGPRTLFVLGLWSTAFALVLTGMTADFNLLLVLRVASGVSGALAFIMGSVLAANLFPSDRSRSAAAIAIYFAGGGVGLLLPGVSLPWLFALGGDSAWRAAWVGMGLVSILASAIATLSAMRVLAPAPGDGAGSWSPWALWPTFAGYAHFAFGYIAYMTFVIAWMREHGASAGEISLVWGFLGLSTLVAPRVWHRPLAHWRGGRPLAATLLCVGIGSGLPLLSTSLPAMLVSAALVGGSFFTTPATITSYVRRVLPPSAWAEAVSAFTLCFAFFQCLGPIATGALADAFNSLAYGLAISAAIVLVGAAIALLQREPSRST